MTRFGLGRRGVLLGAAAVAGCAAPLAELGVSRSTPDAQALLAESASAHGMTAFSRLSDISVSYAGQWHGLVGTLQPALVNSGFRGSSQERLLLRERLVAQSYAGPDGHKEVVRRDAPGGDVRVWFNGTESHDAEARDAAALVADGYALFLLGPLLLNQQWAVERTLVMALAPPVRLLIDGQERICDVLRVRMTPGIGAAASDELALYIDRDARLMRRVRFTVNGLSTTQGAVAEVDTFAHVDHAGIAWPTVFHERLLRPAPLPVHDWQLTGLDLDRGLSAADVVGPVLAGKAEAPAGQGFALDPPKAGGQWIP